MTLLETIKDKIIECMKNGSTLERDTLKTVIGEAQKVNLSPSDKDILQVLKKSKQGCADNMVLVDENKWGVWPQEVAIYDQYLPTELSLQEIIDVAKTLDGILEAKSDGQATGIVKKHFSSNGQDVNGRVIMRAVSQIRKIS